MTSAILIPSRYGSTRFPGKPLALIAGRSLIEHVYRRAMTSTQSKVVIVATDDRRIHDHVAGFGGRSIMTAGEFATGTDRIAAALTMLEAGGERYDYVVNLQGDEPLIDISSVDRIFHALERDSEEIVTLACRLGSDAEFENPDVVKVVTDDAGRALYFSRAPIPWGARQLAGRHVGIYGFRREVLLRISALPQSSLEQAERLEQLRALQNGYKIKVLETNQPHVGVDRFEDIAKVEHELATYPSPSEN